MIAESQSPATVEVDIDEFNKFLNYLRRVWAARDVLQSLCNKPMPPAKNGADRGFCTHLPHQGRCGSETCPLCAVQLTSENAPPSSLTKGRRKGRCRDCETKYSRAKQNHPRNIEALIVKLLLKQGPTARHVIEAKVNLNRRDKEGRHAGQVMDELLSVGALMSECTKAGKRGRPVTKVWLYTDTR